MLKIYNTLTRKKEEFIPLEGRNVKMYACGITVSGDAHIGHAYQALIYDIIRKYLVKCGFVVTYARNYTDVDDKIIAKSNETGIPADEYAAMMIEKIDSEMRQLEVGDPDVWLKATCTIDGIIAFIERLIEKDHAYATKEGDVYFSVDSFAGYGKLSGRNLEDARESGRIENEENKKSPLDFALWKSAKDGEISWTSPWGKGRPGWHIECSAMNMEAFGEQIDIHGGGRDLIFPHHENEIAQTEALTGKQFAKYWIHNGLIKVNGQKMSKSLGNSLLLSDLLAKYPAEVIKFALLQTNYRGDINVTDNLFPDAYKHLYNFYKVLLEVEKASDSCEKSAEKVAKNSKKTAKNGDNSNANSSEIDSAFNAAMDDDFNTAKAIADLFGYFKKLKAKLKSDDIEGAVADAAEIKAVYGLLGFFDKVPAEFVSAYEKENGIQRAVVKEGASGDAAAQSAIAEGAVSSDIAPDVLALAEKRLQAKRDKNWALADSLRAEIAEKGYEIKDTKDGFELAKK